MKVFDFTDPTDGKKIIIRGPDTLDREQAYKIFQQQLNAGALVDLQPGESITPLSQLANGLVTAEASVLGGNKSVLTPNSISVSTPATAGIAISIPLPVSNRNTGLRTTTPDLEVSNTLASSLTGSIEIDETIDVGDYARQTPTENTVGSLTNIEMTSTLSQIRKLAPQPAQVATAQGVGEYSLSPSQLEAAGYLKSGTVGRWLALGQNSLVNVLKSPRVWTGKDNINTIQDLLSNPALQQTIQTQLMQQGFGAIVELGFNVENLPARAQAGVAASAARDLPSTVELLQGQPVGASFSQEFSKLVRDNAYAVDFADSKLNNALKRQAPARGYIGSTQRKQINAAVQRLVGNDKVPMFSYGSEVYNSVIQAELSNLAQSYKDVVTTIEIIQAQQLTSLNIASRRSQLLSISGTVASILLSVQQLKNRAEQQQESSTVITQIPQLLDQVRKLQVTVQDLLILIQRISSQYQGTFGNVIV